MKPENKTENLYKRQIFGHIISIAMLLSLLVTLPVVLPSANNSETSIDSCNISTENTCFDINWAQVTPGQITSLDIHARDTKGRTALHWAASKSSNPAIIDALVKAGANVNAENFNHMTPLHIAVKGNVNPGIVKKLLESGADTYCKDTFGHTPFEYVQEN